MFYRTLYGALSPMMEVSVKQPDPGLTYTGMLSGDLGRVFAAVPAKDAARESSVLASHSLRLLNVTAAPQKITAQPTTLEVGGAEPNSLAPVRMAPALAPITATIADTVASAAGTVGSAPSITLARWPVWRRGDGVTAQTTADKGGLEGYEVLTGKYVLHFDASGLEGLPFTGFSGAMPFTVAGKKCVLQKVVWDRASNEAMVQIEVVQNPLPILAIVAGIGGLIALPLLQSNLKQIDRIIVDLSNLALAGTVALGGWVIYKWVT